MPEVDTPRPTLMFPALPLQGLTLLLVEDSRYACDALRLMAQRSGARLRRAETLGQARRHLALYRPDIVLVDLGLPDGPGTALIRELAAVRGSPVVIALSGDAAGMGSALDAGAAAFVEKPLPGLAAFQRLMLTHLPDRPVAPMSDPVDVVVPDPDRLALHDDLARAADLLATAPDAGLRGYLAQFLVGVARSAEDRTLEQAARHLPEGGADGLRRVTGLVAARLAMTPAAFVSPHR